MVMGNDNIALFLLPEKDTVRKGEALRYSAYIRNMSPATVRNVTLFVYTDECLVAVPSSFEPEIGENESFLSGIKVGDVGVGETRIFSFSAYVPEEYSGSVTVSRVHIRFARNGATDFRVSPRATVNVVADTEETPETGDRSVCEILYSDFFVIEGLRRVLNVYVRTLNAVITTFGVVLDMEITIVYRDTEGVTRTSTQCRCTLLQACPATYANPVITYGEYEITGGGYRILLEIPITITQD